MENENMFPGYWSEGADTENCANCVRYRPNVTNKKKGSCIGRDVIATGGCEKFTPKKAKVKKKVRK
jgi:hypothetical protein